MLLVFKSPQVKPYWFSNPDVTETHVSSAGPQCPGRLVWGLILFLLCAWGAPPVCGGSGRGLVPDSVFAPPTFFDMASSPQLAVEGLLC